MNTKIEAHSKSDLIKIFAAVGVLIVAMVGFYYYGDESLVLRVVGLSIAAVVVVVLLSKTVSGREVWHFAQDSKVEVRKVVWPTRQETIQTTLVVLVMVVIVALMLWGLDTLLFAIVQWLTGR